MRIRNTSSIILDLDEYLKYEDKHLFEIISVRDFGNNQFLVVKEENKKYDVYKSHNVNIAIASAITAYGRIFMSKFKNNPEIILLYTDTDSIFILSPLSPDLVSDTALGQMKFVGAFNSGIFLGSS